MIPEKARNHPSLTRNRAAIDNQQNQNSMALFIIYGHRLAAGDHRLMAEGTAGIVFISSNNMFYSLRL